MTSKGRIPTFTSLLLSIKRPRPEKHGILIKYTLLISNNDIFGSVQYNKFHSLTPKGRTKINSQSKRVHRQGKAPTKPVE